MRYASACPATAAGTGWRRLLSIAGSHRPRRRRPCGRRVRDGQRRRGASRVSASSDQGLLVRAHASAERLYPGARQDVSLLVTNRGDRAVTTSSVRHVGIVVTGSAGHCGRSDFTMQRATPSVTLIPAGATRRLDLPGAIGMKRSAGDGCQGATLRLVMSVDAS